MLKHSFIAIAALGMGLIGLPASQASAFPAAPAIQSDTNPLLIDVKNHRDGKRGDWKKYNNNRHWDRHRHGDRCNRWSSRCRYRYGNFFYENPWWILPMVGAGIAIGASGNDGYGSRHVEWCLNRYRSYNVRTNTWVSYSGRVNQCVSPYGP
jgi:hypothetical protein